ncbi:MAG: hypothetical protein E7H60_23120 [Pseudomonas oryzihabitans]|uniref:hypothetical protein n=1 Tax=Pseudomonas oryzihabitans TaxID=47885 RepID=UPI00290B05BB|nr:hypothetical protein [Pseudomonas oryzihabitans]MDU4059440.1 hypothetical protein [Pseudomonas oryzihabitans]
MSATGSDFVRKVQSVIWDSFLSMEKHGAARKRIDNHRAGAQAVLDAVGADEISQHRREGFDRQRMKIAANERSIEIYDLAINIAAGSILQIAKQAISMQHHGLAECPTGRCISGFYVKDLIWYGRNQSMHYEAALIGATRTFIERLEKELPVQFPRKEPATSHAKAILDLMGWSSDTSLIESDMAELLPP